MGYNRGNEVFDPVAKHVVMLVKHNAIIEYAGFSILSRLIDALQQEDWDTEDESLTSFKEYPWIVDAFAQNGIFLNKDDDG